MEAGNVTSKGSLPQWPGDVKHGVNSTAALAVGGESTGKCILESFRCVADRKVPLPPARALSRLPPPHPETSWRSTIAPGVLRYNITYANDNASANHYHLHYHLHYHYASHLPVDNAGVDDSHYHLHFHSQVRPKRR